MAVYFIRPVGMLGPVKIGCSGVPHYRLKALAAWSPFPLEVAAKIEYGDQTLERRLHGIFAASHSHKEWFRETPELTALIDRLAAGSRIEDLIDMSAPAINFRAKRIFTADRRRYLSYAGRIRCGFAKLRKDNESGAWCCPHDVSEIMARWAGDRDVLPALPSPAEFTRLEEVIANPRAHALTWNEKYPEYPLVKGSAA